MAEPCMGVLLVVRSNLFPFAAKAVSALPAEISIPSSAPLPCLSKSFNAFTDIAFLPFLRNFVSSSAEIALCSIVFFILFATLFFVCSANSIKLSILLPALSVFFIPLGVAFNGILIFTFSFPKSLSDVSRLGNASNTSTMLSCANLSVLLCLIDSMINSAILSRKSNLTSTRIIARDSTFMPSPTTAILLSFPSILVAILADPLLLLPVSILTPALMLLFITTGMRITNSLSKLFPPLNSLSASLSISPTSISK